MHLLDWLEKVHQLPPPARQSAVGADVCMLRMIGLAVAEKSAHACNRVVVSHLTQTRCLNVWNLGPGFAALYRHDKWAF